MKRVQLYFHMIQVTVMSAHAELIENIRRDFACFMVRKESVRYRISVHGVYEAPNFSRITKPFFFRTHDATCYGYGDMRYIRYDDALCMYDARNETGTVWAGDPLLLHQHTYYMIIAKVGEFYDGEGFHRLHALGVSHACGALFFPMGIGGGKTTLCMAMLRDDAFRLFSEDTPMIGRDLYARALPVRLAVRTNDADHIDGQYKRTLKESCFGQKHLVDVAAFGNGRVENAQNKKLKYLFFGVRDGGGEPRLIKKNRLFVAWYLLICFVKGEDFPQKKEYMIRLSWRGWKLLWITFISRLYVAMRMVMQVRAYTFYMSSDSACNVAAIKACSEK